MLCIHIRIKKNKSDELIIFKYMKKIYSILMLVVLTCLLATTSGYDYRITGLYKTDGVTIGGKSLNLGDQFYKTDTINWNNNNKAMIGVVEIATSKQYIFTRYQFVACKSKTVEELLRTRKSSSTR